MSDLKKLEMLDGIDDEFIVSAENGRSRRSFWRYAIPAAAAACLVLGAALILGNALKKDPKPDDKTAFGTAHPSDTTAFDSEKPIPTEAEKTFGPTGEPVYIPRADLMNYSENQPDYIRRLIVCNGRIYSCLGVFPQFTDVLGEKIGRITQYFPAYDGELVPEDGNGEAGYNTDDFELSGTVTGSVFAVKGYDPEFMLCMRGSNGEVEIYINDNDVSLYSGRDLFEDRLHVSERLSELGYLTKDDALYKIDEAEYSEAARLFIEAIDGGEWVEFADQHNHYSGSESAVLFLNDGIFLQPVIYEEDGVIALGYTGSTIGEILFKGYALKVDMEKVKPLLDIIRENRGAEAGRLWSSEDFTEADCRADAVFGELIPRVIPEGFEIWRMYIFYDFDEDTGEFLGTRAIEIDYKKPGLESGAYFSLELTGRDLLNGLDPIPVYSDIHNCEMLLPADCAAPLDGFTADDIIVSGVVKWGDWTKTCYAVAVYGDIGIYLKADYLENVEPDLNDIMAIIGSMLG